MRIQFVAGLALLQVQNFAAAATGKGSNVMVDTGRNHGIAGGMHGHQDHDIKLHASSQGGQGGHGASNGDFKPGASSNHESHKKGKGVPRMETFPGVHLSPVEGGVVNHLGSEKLDERSLWNGVLPSDQDRIPECNEITEGGNALPNSKRCSGLETSHENVPDPSPTGCGTHCPHIARSIAEEGSATAETRALPTGLLGSSERCPIVGRRGDFLVRRCTHETIGVPIWVKQELNTEPITAAVNKKRSPTANEVWTRSDGGQSYFECGDIDRRGEFVAKRCPEETLGGDPINLDSLSKVLVPTASSTKKHVSGTTERSLFSSGLPSVIEQCGMMGRGELVVRFVCCDTDCGVTKLVDQGSNSGEYVPVGERVGATTSY